MARKHLLEIEKENGDVSFEEVDVMANPLKTWKDGVRMIPAIRIGDKILSGLYLSREAVKKFITAEKNQL